MTNVNTKRLLELPVPKVLGVWIVQSRCEGLSLTVFQD